MEFQTMDKSLPSDYKKEEIEKIIIKLLKEEKNPSMIGMILRDSYGIGSIKMRTDKTLSQILKDNDSLPNLPENLFFLIKKSISLREHLLKNKKDFHSKRGLELTESKIRRLAKYYIRKGVLPEDWKYDPEKAKLLI